MNTPVKIERAPQATTIDRAARFENDKASQVAALRHLAAKLESYTREVEAEPFNAPIHVWKAIQWKELHLLIAMQQAFDWVDGKEFEDWRITLCEELEINPNTGYPVRADGEDMDQGEAGFDNRYFVAEWM